MRTDEPTTAPAKPARIDYASVFPAGVRAMVGIKHAVDAARLEPLLLGLVKLRASQINGCAHCLDVHSKDARALGESEQRLHLLAAWRDAPCYDAREQAALAWCEHLTLISEAGAPDAVYEKLEESFSADEIVADLCDRGHQRLEPAGHIHAGAGGRLRVTAPPDIEPCRPQRAAWALRSPAC